MVWVKILVCHKFNKCQHLALSCGQYASVLSIVHKRLNFLRSCTPLQLIALWLFLFGQNERGAFRVLFHVGLDGCLYAYAVGIKTGFLPLQIYKGRIGQDGCISHRAVQECLSAILVVPIGFQDRRVDNKAIIRDS